MCQREAPQMRSCWLLWSAVRRGVHLTCLFLGNVTSASGSQMASGISLVSFNSRPDGMHQRSYSVSSADQWSDATVIANSAISSGKRGHNCGHLPVLCESQGLGSVPRAPVLHWEHGAMGCCDSGTHVSPVICERFVLDLLSHLHPTIHPFSAQGVDLVLFTCQI